MKLYYSNEYYGLEFGHFKNNGYELVELSHNDYSYINNIQNNDVLFIKLDAEQVGIEVIKPTNF